MKNWMKGTLSLPQVLDDPVLGRLEWDADGPCWVGDTDFKPGRSIGVYVNFDPDEQVLVEVLSRARATMQRLRQEEAAYRRWTAERLLDKRWNRDEPMGVEDVAGLLEVASIDFDSDGGARVYWDDQDVLFYGHNVITRIRPDGECVEAGMG
jgi:hypothetical protein